MGYIEQFYTWSTANVLTAARLNGNISAIIDGLDAGSKDITMMRKIRLYSAKYWSNPPMLRMEQKMAK